MFSVFVSFRDLCVHIWRNGFSLYSGDASDGDNDASCGSGNAVSAAEKCEHKVVTLISMSKEVSGDCEAVAFE